MKHLLLSGSTLIGLASVLAVSCYPYDTTPKLCEDAVPEGGCPTGRGGTCDDPTCKALYDCEDAVWTKKTTCPGTGGTAGSGGVGGSGGSTQTGGSGGDTSTAGAGGCTPSALDHTGETTGCTPDLQSPDCPASAAEPCAETACLTGCTDFYVCKQDAAGKAWTAVGYCDDKGHLVASP